MNFLQIKELFESGLTSDFEVLELHYVPYAFGSGFAAYRTKGQIVKIIFDGKDSQVQLLISARHDKYPNASFTTIYKGLPTDFIENGIAKLHDLNGQGA